MPTAVADFNMPPRHNVIVAESHRPGPAHASPPRGCERNQRDSTGGCEPTVELPANPLTGISDGLPRLLRMIHASHSPCCDLFLGGGI
jgi:hypothetical protein